MKFSLCFRVDYNYMYYESFLVELGTLNINRITRKAESWREIIENIKENIFLYLSTSMVSLISNHPEHGFPEQSMSDIFKTPDCFS